MIPKLRRRCKCGCGGITSPGKKWISSHHSKVNPPKAWAGITGKSHPRYKHGLSKHKLWQVWQGMKKRCYNSNCKAFPNYGSRGIRVCIKWKGNVKSFYNWAMANGWKEGLEIDRIDNDGNYHPDNCRFVTRKVNCNNQRKVRKNNTTGYKGVGFNKAANKYQVRVTINDKRKYLGLYNTIKEAAQAIKEYHE